MVESEVTMNRAQRRKALKLKTPLKEGEFVSQTIAAPRIEVALTGNAENGPYEVWLVLHVPDGGPPTTVKLGGKDEMIYSKGDAVQMLLDIYTEIGERHAFPGAELFPDRPAVQ